MRHDGGWRSRDLEMRPGNTRDLRTSETPSEGGTDPTASDPQSWTALHFAACLDDVEAAKIFMETGADVSAVADVSRSTPLHYARSSEMVKLLLEAGADPFAEDLYQRTPMDIAIEHRRLAVIECLFQAGTDEGGRWMGPLPCLYRPMCNGNVEMTKELLKLGASPWGGAESDIVPWFGATESCRRAAITHLVETACDSNAIHDNISRDSVEKFVLEKIHEAGGRLTEDNFPTITRLIDDELCIRVPIREAFRHLLDLTLNLSKMCLMVKTRTYCMSDLIQAYFEMQDAYDLQSSATQFLVDLTICIVALFNNSKNKFHCDIKFMKRKRPPCLSMPWTIWPALVVLWGVCWMFIYYSTPEDLAWLDLSGNNGTSSELNDVTFWNAVSAEQLFCLDSAVDGSAQAIETGKVFPSMITTGVLPDVATQFDDFADPNWGLHSATPRAIRQSQGSLDKPELFQIAPKAPGTAPGVGAMTAISSEAAQRQKSFRCDSCSSKFGRRSTLQRHQREQHGPSGKTYFCPRQSCKHSVNGQGFSRQEQLDRHLRDAKYCRSNSASKVAIVQPVGYATEGHQKQASGGDMHSVKYVSSLPSSPLEIASLVPEASDTVTYTETWLRSRVASLVDEERQCEAEEREVMAEIAARKKRISDEKKQAQAALDALQSQDRPPI